MLHVIAATEGAVGAEVHELDAEGGGWVGGVRSPDVHVEVGHGRGVDGRRGELDPGKDQVRILLHVAPSDLNVFDVRVIPGGGPGVYGDVGVGVAEKRDDVRRIACRSGCGVPRSLNRGHRDGARGFHRSQCRRDGGRALTDHDDLAGS